MKLPYWIADVFTNRALGGNPLAVFPDAPVLKDQLMQDIARELNLSETVFVRPAADSRHDAALRIFTPSVELPFAGHPTVGSALVLARLEKLPGARRSGDVMEIVFEEGVGPIPVTVRLRDGKPTFAQFTTAKLPSFQPAASADTLAEALGLSLDEIGFAREGIVQTPQIASCGVPFVCVPLRDLAALGRARVNAIAVERLLKTAAATGFPDGLSFYLYTPGEAGPDSLRTRMYGSGVGIAEDPATGSAAAALAGVLAARDPRREGTLRWAIHQGHEMRRPSLIEIEADKRENAIQAVRVGGSAVVIGSGELAL